MPQPVLPGELYNLAGVLGSQWEWGIGGSIGLNTVVLVPLLTNHNDCVASCMAGKMIVDFACYIYDIHATEFSLYT